MLFNLVLAIYFYLIELEFHDYDPYGFYCYAPILLVKIYIAKHFLQFLQFVMHRLTKLLNLCINVIIHHR